MMHQRFRRAQVCVAGVYFLNGAVFTSWYARLPAIQEQLQLRAGELGLALLGAPLGLLLAQPIVGALAARRGSRALIAAAPFYLAAVVLPAVAVDATTLLLAVLVVGAANGALDIAMNAQGIAMERAVTKQLFNSLHATFSFGALAGAGLAATAAAAAVPPLPHLAASAATGAAIALLLARGLLPDKGAPDAPRIARPTRRLAALGVVAFCVLLAEGAAFDWSGIYLATEAGAAAGMAPLGLAAFALCMGLGRLIGDQVAARVGAPATARGGALLAAAGLGLALASATPNTAIAGFAFMGLGLSTVFPLTLRASGSHEDAPGPALAAVSTIGYAGFLTGPPIIGLLANVTGGLRIALILVCVLCVFAALFTIHVNERHIIS